MQVGDKVRYRDDSTIYKVISIEEIEDDDGCDSEYGRIVRRLIWIDAEDEKGKSVFGLDYHFKKVE